MYTADIHSNFETVKEAIYNLDIAISFARKEKDKLLCLIIGYGSKGTKHKIKTEILNKLNEYLDNKKIKGYLVGSEIDIFNGNYQKFIYKDRIPEKDKIIKNPGAIYIAV